MMEIVKVEKVYKSFGTLEVIRGISFSVHRGEVLAIIGPSGSGKSTILRCITQLEAVSSGSISICGEKLTGADQKTRRSLMLKTGLVFQNFNLFPHFSVLQNITEAQIRVLALSKFEAEKKAQDLLAKMGLADKEKVFPFELSGGQQQRVSIARALALQPEVLCFDEPTSALDPELTGEILKVIRSLAAEKMTMIVVTHEIAFARDIADKIIFMDAGLIIEEGGARQLIDEPCRERTKAFLNRYSQNGV